MCAEANYMTFPFLPFLTASCVSAKAPVFNVGVPAMVGYELINSQFAWILAGGDKQSANPVSKVKNNTNKKLYFH